MSNSDPAFVLQRRAAVYHGVLDWVELLLETLLTTREDGGSLLTQDKAAWNDNVLPQFPKLDVHSLIEFLADQPVYGYYSREKLAEEIPCQMDVWNTRLATAAAGSHMSPSLGSCYLWNLSNSDPDFWLDDMDLVESQMPNKRSVNLIYDVDKPVTEAHYLEKRVGAPRNYVVQLGQDGNGNEQIIIIVSWSYPNGRNGEALITANGMTDRYTLSNPSDCADSSFTNSAKAADAPAWVGELEEPSSSRTHA